MLVKVRKMPIFMPGIENMKTSLCKGGSDDKTDLALK